MGAIVIDYKELLTEHLKNQHINCISDLWAHSKDFFRRKLIEMGGGYASTNKFISVAIRVDNKLQVFHVSLSE